MTTRIPGRKPPKDMWILYDFCFAVIALMHLPVYLCKGKFHQGFASRWGKVPAAEIPQSPWWVHAVSVGEAMAVKGLVQQLREVYPGIRFVFTTVTPTGNAIVRSFAQQGDLVTFLPFDLRGVMRRFVSAVKPRACVIAETEIWPNLVMCLAERGVPVMVVNGRISDRSFRGYRMIRRLIAPVLNRYRVLCMQTQRDAQRLLELGVSPEKIRVTGNLKFDAVSAQGIDGSAVRSVLKLGQGQPLLVAGSTHPGEEEMVLKAWDQARRRVKGLCLVLAPRHPERSSEVAALVRRVQAQPVLCSRLPAEGGADTVYILDTVGRLLTFYAAADVVFVGGSLVPKGGHNIIEPAVFSKPILCGPHMHNFRDIAELFSRAQAFVTVHSAEELAVKVTQLLEERMAALALGTRAKNVLMQNQGATVLTLNALRDAFGVK